MSNPWQQVFETHRDHVEQNYIAEKYGQHKSDESEETQALYDLRNKLKNMGKDAVVAYLKRSKMSPERKARLARELGISIAEEFVDEGAAAQLLRLALMGGTAAAGAGVMKSAEGIAKKLEKVNKEKEAAYKKYESNETDGDDIQEMTPPGDKYERMVKHIKSGYKEGGLTQKEKSIAYATAWKAKNKETAKEEFEALQEEAKILVRVTKEDGSVFQKKIPASQLDDYRKRYKTVVVVGGSEQSKMGVTSKNEEYVSEAKKKKPARWWDDDGDGKGYEPGEVSGKFKKKKVKEEYSDWRSEYPDLAEATKAQKSVQGHTNAIYGGEREDKKKRKKKSAKSECGCSHEVKEAAEVLAYELGGDLIDIQEYAKAATSVIRAFVKPKPIVVPQRVVPFIRPTKPAPIVPAKPQPAPVPAPKPGKPAPSPKPEKPVPSPKPGKPTKPEPKTKPQPQPKPATKPTKTGVLVKIDQKTGAITGSQTKPQAKPQPLPAQTKPPISTPPKPPKGGRPGPGGGTPKRLPNLCTPVSNPLTGRMELPPWCKPKPYLKDPVADPGTLKL